MATDLNLCVFIGRLGADPECRVMPNGNAVTNIRIAVGKQWKDKNTGNKQESTEWVPIVFFNALAEIAGKYLRKGSRIRVNGEFRTRQWTAQDGNKRYTTEIVASDMQMLDSPQGAGQGGYAGQGGGGASYGLSAQHHPAPHHQPPAQPAPNQDGFDDWDDGPAPF